MSATDTMIVSKPLQNIIPEVGKRHYIETNSFGLKGIDHFALPTRNMPLLERFVREVLDGVPYCYAGFDEIDKSLGRKPHIFLRIGGVLFQCTEENSPTQPDPADTHISPHWAFRVSPADLDANMNRLRSLGIPVQGPMQHRGMDLTSIYFLSPEGHKFEICTWESYPSERSKQGRIDWPKLAHNWPNL